MRSIQFHTFLATVNLRLCQLMNWPQISCFACSFPASTSWATWCDKDKTMDLDSSEDLFDVSKQTEFKCCSIFFNNGIKRQIRNCRNTSDHDCSKRSHRQTRRESWGKDQHGHNQQFFHCVKIATVRISRLMTFPLIQTKLLQLVAK